MNKISDRLHDMFLTELETKNKGKANYDDFFYLNYISWLQTRVVKLEKIIKKMENKNE